jgi:polyhydroxyalkanoate synthesis regulator phasin
MVTRKVSEPVQDAVKAYLELAMGLTEASKKRAEKTVKKVTRELLGRGGTTASQLQGLAEDLVNTGMANREAVNRLVRVEMDRALGRLGLATADDVATLADRLDALERQLRDAQAGSPATHAAAETAANKAEPVAVATTAPAKKVVAKKTVATKAIAKKSVAEKSVAKKSVAKKAGEGTSSTASPGAKTAPAKKAPAKKAPAKKAPAKKAATKAATKAPAKKAAKKAGGRS